MCRSIRTSLLAVLVLDLAAGVVVECKVGEDSRPHVGRGVDEVPV